MLQRYNPPPANRRLDTIGTLLRNGTRIPAYTSHRQLADAEVAPGAAFLAQKMLRFLIHAGVLPFLRWERGLTLRAAEVQMACATALKRAGVEWF